MSFSRRSFLKSSGALPGAWSLGLPVRRESDDGAGVTRALARFVVESTASDVPESARKEATRTIVNWVGCALGGARHETVHRALEAVSELSGPRAASVLGRKDRLDILHASLLNGISSHVLDFDDTHLETIIHPAGPVAPVLLALAERRPMGGADFLHAFILGVEVECRVGLSVYPSHYDRGYHITGSAGVFGAAAAAGKVLALDETQMTWALGLAATQSAGLREMFGTMSKAFHPGRAAQNGLTAALLAAKSYTSSEASLEAPRGFAHVLSGERDFSKLTRGLGETWEVAKNTYKPFPCGIVIHPTIDACIQLRNEHSLAGADIERVELQVHPLVLELTGKKTPAKGLEGKFSVYHSAAVALLRGTVGQKEYSDEAVRDPEVVALRDRVVATVEPGIREEEVRARVILKSGRSLEKRVEHAVGSLENPLTDRDLETKFRGQAEAVLAASAIHPLLSLCWNVASLPDAAAIAKASVPA
ncbi:MAG TPA: MmgE/PrpD family protein [Vicinamibacteria bacterium]|nr:MmgE/PrpD family protein [Vicinamibacteria bacterium]